jgi:hypothetical protein
LQLVSKFKQRASLDFFHGAELLTPALKASSTTAEIGRMFGGYPLSDTDQNQGVTWNPLLV